MIKQGWSIEQDCMKELLRAYAEFNNKKIEDLRRRAMNRKYTQEETALLADLGMRASYGRQPDVIRDFVENSQDAEVQYSAYKLICEFLYDFPENGYHKYEFEDIFKGREKLFVEKYTPQEMEKCFNDCGIVKKHGTDQGFDIITNNYVLHINHVGSIDRFLFKLDNSSSLSVSHRPFAYGQFSDFVNYLKEYPALFLDLHNSYFTRKYKKELKTLMKITKQSIKEKVGDVVTENEITDFQELMTAITEKCAIEKQKAKKVDIADKVWDKDFAEWEKKCNKREEQLDKALKTGRHK